MTIYIASRSWEKRAGPSHRARPGPDLHSAQSEDGRARTDAVSLLMLMPAWHAVSSLLRSSCPSLVLCMLCYIQRLLYWFSRSVGHRSPALFPLDPASPSSLGDTEGGAHCSRRRESFLLFSFLPGLILRHDPRQTRAYKNGKGHGRNVTRKFRPPRCPPHHHHL